MNCICLTLCLRSAPEHRRTENGTDLGVAVGILEMRKGDAEPTYQNILVDVWKDVDDFLRLSEGDLVNFEGSVRFDTKDNGSYKQKSTTLNCRNFQLVGHTACPPAPKASAQTGVDFAKRTSAATQTTKVAPIAPVIVNDSSADYDDIPF